MREGKKWEKGLDNNGNIEGISICGLSWRPRGSRVSGMRSVARKRPMTGWMWWVRCG